MIRFNIDSARNMDFAVYDTSFRAGIRTDSKVLNVSFRKMNGFLYLFSGGVEITDGKKNVITASSNNLVFIPKNSSYKLRYKGEAHFSLINFNARLVDGAECGLFDNSSIVIVNDILDSKIESLFKKVEKESLFEGRDMIFRQKELLYRLLRYLSVNSFLDSDVVPEKIRHGAQILEQSCLKDITIADVARECYVSVSTFRRLFTKHYGVSPMQYRNQLRIKHATMLLSDGEYTVAEVAELSGFSSVNYFCRLYKKIVGKTPTSNKDI